MSNRSYWDEDTSSWDEASATFNSPWECRIGLTYGDDVVYTGVIPFAFNSPWECRIGLTKV